MQAYCEIAKDMGVNIRKEEGRSLCVVAFRGEVSLNSQLGMMST